MIRMTCTFLLLSFSLTLLVAQEKRPHTKWDDMAIIINYPENPIAIPNDDSFWNKMAHLMDFNHDGYLMVGHTGVILVDGESGDLEYFDMGRYDDRDDLVGPRGDQYGVVRSALHVEPLHLDIKATIVNGWLTNLDAILGKLALCPLLADYGSMDPVVVYEVNLERMKERARRFEDLGFIRYGAPNHLYCTNFVRKVIKSGGHKFSWMIYTGKQTVDYMKKRYRQ